MDTLKSATILALVGIGLTLIVAIALIILSASYRAN